MQAVIAYLFLALFVVSLLVTYILARQDRMPILPISVIGLVGSTLSLMGYKLLIGGTLGDAIVIGLGLGFLFTLASLSAGVFFSANTKSES
jgi:hypothetical protein